MDIQREHGCFVMGKVSTFMFSGVNRLLASVIITAQIIIINEYATHLRSTLWFMNDVSCVRVSTVFTSISVFFSPATFLNTVSAQ